MTQEKDNAPRLQWRSSGRIPLVPQVQIPRALALDLIRFWCPWVFSEDVTEGEFNEDKHEEMAEDHRNRMAAMEDMVVMEICDQGIPPTADNLLRVLGIAYETSVLIGTRGGECRLK